MSLVPTVIPGISMVLTPPTTGTVFSIPSTLTVTVPEASLGKVTLITATSPRVILVVFTIMAGATLLNWTELFLSAGL